jgi:hypothetical protein
MPTPEQTLAQALEKLTKDVELAVHAMYRGDVRQNTAKARTDSFRKAAYEALRPLVGGAAPGTARSATTNPSLGALATDDVSAVMRCILAWLPMGAPAQASAESRCVAASRELFPTWGDRERAREAIKRLHS